MYTEDDVKALAEKLGKTKVWKKGTHSETIELSEAIGWNSVYRLARVELEFCEERGMLRRKVEPDVNPHPEIYNEEPK